MPSRATSPLAVSRALNTLLEGHYWPASLQVQRAYTRRQDDTDGKTSAEQDLTVAFGPDGDAWLDAGLLSLRFRSGAGGGMSPRTRAALMVLAEAIRRDNEDRPQRPGQLKADDPALTVPEPVPTVPLEQLVIAAGELHEVANEYHGTPSLRGRIMQVLRKLASQT